MLAAIAQQLLVVRLLVFDVETHHTAFEVHLISERVRYYQLLVLPFNVAQSLSDKSKKSCVMSFLTIFVRLPLLFYRTYLLNVRRKLAPRFVSLNVLLNLHCGV